MTLNEKIHLENQNFVSSLTTSLFSLLDTSSLCDCTLICSDGQLSSHKVILAASSSFFRTVFSLNHQHHFFIYLRGIKTEQMQAVLNYVYQGGTHLEQEDLSSFLVIAEDLQIKGLIRQKDIADLKKPDRLAESPVLERMDDYNNDDFNFFDKFKEKENSRAQVDVEHIDMKKRKGKKRKFHVNENIPSEQSASARTECENTLQEKLEGQNQKNNTEDISNEMESIDIITSSHIRESAKIEMTCEDPSIVLKKTEYKAAEEPGPKEEFIDHIESETPGHSLDPLTSLTESIEFENKSYELVKEVGYLHKLKQPKERIVKHELLIPSLPCLVCKTKTRDEMDLKKHMKAKREVKCENCDLYFRNCNSLSVHVKSNRCRNNKKINN